MATEIRQLDNKKIPKLRFPDFSGSWTDMSLGSFLNERSEYPKEAYPLYSLTIENGITPKTDRYERSFLVKAGKEAYKVVHANDFAYNPMNLRFGALARHKGKNKVLVSKYYNIFYGNKNVDPNFLEAYITRNKMVQFYNRMATGSLEEKKRVHYLDFVKFIKPFPLLSEQKKIASFLDNIDEWICNLRTQKENFELYKKGMMRKIFAQEIRFDNDNGSVFPIWEERMLADVGKTYNGLVGKAGEDFGSGDAFITYKQIFDDSEIKTDKFAFVRIDPREKQNKAQFGDIFFTTSSETPNEVGFASVLLDKNVMPYLNSFSFGFRPNSLKELDPYFARFFFRSFIFRQGVVKLAQGSTRYNISKIGFMKIKMMMPSLPEQQKIADFLTSIDKLIDSKQQQITQAEEWKKGLIQGLFV